MGASFRTQRIKATSGRELGEKFAKLINALRCECGHNACNGTFTTNKGLDITMMVFKTEDDAEAWLVDNCVKWGSVRAVRIHSFKKGIEPYWLLGAYCSE